ncbi:rubrerythrin family protein [Microbispora sp. NBC_01189]|uniref:ferritin family protein n=1 Tax=Microbispora sp. NBC_01189 TaxID=2903583 RepID=UPI002E134E2D|nr:rubrerythrin family protein [Microbispora sp. NBC_01189]
METRGLVCWRISLTIAGTVVLLSVGAGCAMAASAPRSDDVDPSTRTNVTKSMKGEALANVTYRAYAKQADRENLPDVANLYRHTAHSELREHFTEQAELIGLVGDNAANLRDSIGGESYEATTMYKKFARQARADGDQEAARLFSEVGRDEARHREKFLQARKAITDPSSGATIPTDVRAEPVEIQAGPSKVSSSRTLENLRAAMKGEAFAYAKYTLYGDRARETGQPRLARLFHRTAAVERTEHFAEHANLAGAVRDTGTNLCAAIKGETYEGTRMYPGFARQASAAGDTEVAAVLNGTAKDELRHAKAFSGKVAKLGRQCPTSS